MFKVICIEGLKRDPRIDICNKIFLQNPEIYVGDTYMVEEVDKEDNGQVYYTLSERSPMYSYLSTLFAICNSNIDENERNQNECERSDRDVPNLVCL